MYLSDHDRSMEAVRDQEKEDLIANYILSASEHAAKTPDAFLNLRGQEVPDPTIIDPPLGYVPQPDLMTLMRRMIVNEMSRVAEDSQLETFEESDDFEIDDDPVDYSSPYEEYFDPAPDAPKGPPVEPHPARQDPNADPATPPAATTENAPQAAPA